MDIEKIKETLRLYASEEHWPDHSTLAQPFRWLVDLNTFGTDTEPWGPAADLLEELETEET